MYRCFYFVVVLFFCDIWGAFYRVLKLEHVSTIHNVSHHLRLREGLKFNFPDFCLVMKGLEVLLELTSEYVSIVRWSIEQKLGIEVVVFYMGGTTLLQFNNDCSVYNMPSVITGYS